jgi:hypothetical protein
MRSLRETLALAVSWGVVSVAPGFVWPAPVSAQPTNAPAVDTPSPTVSAPPVSTPTVSTPGPTANTPTANAPTPTVSTPTPGVSPAQSVAGGPADGGSNCSKLRADIIDMDARSSTLPGYLDLRATLGGLYARLCDRPTAERAPEFWYDLDGHRLGPATTGRPPGGAFIATEAVARACATAGNPSLCAMLRGSTGMCPDAPDPETRKACVALAGYPTSIEAEGAPPLPPITIVLAGKPYQVAAECADTLANLATSPDVQGDSLRARLKRELMLDQIRSSCPQFLSALEGRLGANAESNPEAFWSALKRLVEAGFGLPGAASAAPSQTAYRDPGLQKMCAQAKANRDICEQRQHNMGPVGQNTHGRSGQAGAFGDCAALYSAVANMCTLTEARAIAPPPVKQAAHQPAVQKSQPPAQPAKPADATAASRPPPAANAGSALSPQCQQLVSNYVAAARANDGSKALAGYNALKQAGGCGVLAKVDRPPPPQPQPTGPDPRFATRGATPLSDSVVGACDASPDECAARVRQLQAGTSAAAQAALISNAIGIGLQLGTMMGGVVLSGVPTAGAGGSIGAGPNMNSIGNRPVRSTYGQGAPAGPPTPTHESTITGTTR